MKKREVFQYSGVFVLFFVPYLFTMAVNGIEAAVLNRAPDPEDYIPALLSQQIPADYEEEAIKAQAVIARTNFFRRMELENRAAVLKEIWDSGERLYTDWSLPKPVYEKAVAETEGQILTSEGELKLVPYHEISNGQTRDGEKAMKSKEYSYLKSVDSSKDKDAPFYLNSVYISREQMPSELNITKREETGHVRSLTADGSLLEGESFARGMGLASSDFSIQKIGGEFRFLSKGKGHGLGFSQYGGNELAKAGSDWKEILEAYFPAMEIAAYEG